jgi:hypothetical protein
MTRLKAIPTMAAILVLGLSLGAAGLGQTPPAAPLSQTPPKTYPPESLRADLQILWDVLDEGHGGFERYTPKEELKRLFDAARDAITNPMTELDFYLRLLPLIVAIKDGHTGLRLSAAASAYLDAQPVFFPFALRFLNNKAYIFRNLSSEAGIKEGSELAAINGLPIEDVLSRLMALIPNDAGIQISQIRRLEFPINFGRFFALRFGYPKTYRLRLGSGQAGREFSVPGIKGLDIEGLLRQRSSQAGGRPPLYEFSFRGTTGLLTIRSFADDASDGRLPYPQFLKSVFGQLAEKKAASLIIDLRGNGGGEDEYGKLLFAHVADQPFLYYRALETKKSRYDFYKFATLPAGFADGFAADTKMNSRGWCDVLNHPNLGLQQPQTPHFSGAVAILIDGLSFSSTGETTSIYHFHRKAVFFGEECGAGYYGNTSGSFVRVTLPNSGIQIGVPLVLYTMAVDGYPKDRGIVPDFPITPTIEDFLAGRDPVMERALKFLADEKRSPSSPAH